MTWYQYHSLEDMYVFFDYLEKKYDFVNTEVIGTSFEGRNMRVVKVCKGGCGTRKAVWIDGGIHARYYKDNPRYHCTGFPYMLWFHLNLQSPIIHI